MTPDLTLATVSSLLRSAAVLDRWSGLLAGVALLWGLFSWPFGYGSPGTTLMAGLMVAAGIAQKYWAVRIAIDADLFARMAQDAARVEELTPRLDQALVSLALMPAGRAERPWADRCRGALRLLRWQQVLVIFQSSLALTWVCISPWLFPSLT